MTNTIAILGSTGSIGRQTLDVAAKLGTRVVCVAAGRPDERPHPYIVSLLKEFTEDVHFTDAVEIPGLVEPVFHTSVHIELP